MVLSPSAPAKEMTEIEKLKAEIKILEAKNGQITEYVKNYYDSAFLIIIHGFL